MASRAALAIPIELEERQWHDKHTILTNHLFEETWHGFQEYRHYIWNPFATAQNPGCDTLVQHNIQGFVQKQLHPSCKSLEDLTESFAQGRANREKQRPATNNINNSSVNFSRNIRAEGEIECTCKWLSMHES